MLSISLLGQPRFLIDGVPVEGFNSNKTRALLCYLAAVGEPVYRTKLAGLLWGEMTEEKAYTNLRKSVANLRKLAGDYLEISPQSVGLSRNREIWVDTVAIHTHSESTDGIV